jgi:hypothetical protein
VCELTKTAVERLALAHLLHAIPQLPQRTTGTVGEATYEVQWSRPALTFPAEAPDAVRLGLVMTGGVRWPTGRILSIETFATLTVIPQLAPGTTGWFVRLQPATPELTPLRLTYAGEPLPPEPVRPALGLPNDAALGALREGLEQELHRFLDLLPDLPLSPGIVTQHVGQIHIAPEGGGAALALCLTPEPTTIAALPVVVTERHPTALLVNGAAFAAQFDALVAPALDALLPTTMRLVALHGTCAQDRLWFAVQASVEVAGETEAVVNATIEAEPLMEAQRLLLRIERVAAESAPGNELAAQTLGEVLTTEGFRERLMELTQTALQHALAEAIETPATDFRWQWALPLALPPETRPFAISATRVAEGYFALLGNWPLPTLPETEEDAPDCDLLVEGMPQPVDDGPMRLVTVGVTHIKGLTPPYDYAWWNGTSQTMLLEHEATLAVALRVAEDDPEDTMPRHLRLHSLPLGITQVRVALMDRMGRVVSTALEVDLHHLSMVNGDPAATVGVFAQSSPAGVTAATRMMTKGMQTQATALAPTVAQVQARSSFLGMVAGALGVFALGAALAALVLTRSLPGFAAQTSTTTNTPVLPTVTATQLAHIPTATAHPKPTATRTPAPTATPERYGRFAATPTTLLFICTAGDTAPQTVTLTNTGTATLTWVVGFFSAPQMPPWGSAAPNTGSLAPNATGQVTITPDSTWCATPTTTTFTLQFSAPNQTVVPYNISVSHT